MQIESVDLPRSNKQCSPRRIYLKLAFEIAHTGYCYAIFVVRLRRASSSCRSSRSWDRWGGRRDRWRSGGRRAVGCADRRRGGFVTALISVSILCVRSSIRLAHALSFFPSKSLTSGSLQQELWHSPSSQTCLCEIQSICSIVVSPKPLTRMLALPPSAARWRLSRAALHSKQAELTRPAAYRTQRRLHLSCLRTASCLWSWSV